MNDSKPVKPQWSVREYQEGDEDQILELRGIVLSDSRDSQWWRWMYRNGPDGPVNLWLADDKQKVVGVNPGLPLRMKIGDQVCKSALCFDVMTHPEYQRQGVLSALGVVGNEYRLNNGFSIDYGTSTLQKYPIYQKLKLPSIIFAICQPPSMVKVINWAKVLKTRYRIPAFIGNLLGYVRERLSRRVSSSHYDDIEVEQISSFNENIDAFWLKASEIKQIMLVRDMKYLNWRYVEKPGNEYVIFLAKRQKEIVGYIVVKKIETKTIIRGAIIDLLTLPREDIVAEALITGAIRYLHREGVAMISCLMLPETPYYRILKKMGFMRRCSRIQLNVRLYDQNLSKEFVTDSSNWYFVWGDTDTT